MTQNAAAGGNFRKDLTLSLHNLNEAGDKDASVSDQFDFVDLDPNDYEDYRDNKFLVSADFEGDVKVRVDELGIVMSGGSTMYEGLTNRGADERNYGDDGSFDLKADLPGDDF